jgi:hypothetical protein
MSNEKRKKQEDLPVRNAGRFTKAGDAVISHDVNVRTYLELQGYELGERGRSCEFQIYRQLRDRPRCNLGKLDDHGILHIFYDVRDNDQFSLASGLAHELDQKQVPYVEKPNREDALADFEVYVSTIRQNLVTEEGK